MWIQKSQVVQTKDESSAVLLQVSHSKRTVFFINVSVCTLCPWWWSTLCSKSTHIKFTINTRIGDLHTTTKNITIETTRAWKERKINLLGKFCTTFVQVQTLTINIGKTTAGICTRAYNWSIANMAGPMLSDNYIVF